MCRLSEFRTCGLLHAVHQNEQGTQGYVPQQCSCNSSLLRNRASHIKGNRFPFLKSRNWFLLLTQPLRYEILIVKGIIFYAAINFESTLYFLFLYTGLCVRVWLHGSCPSYADLQGTSGVPQASHKAVKAPQSRLPAILSR